jgi:GH18 family chitinase
MLAIIRIYFIIIFVFLNTPVIFASPSKGEIASMKKIVGYFPDWGVYEAHRSYYVKHIPWDKLTHIQVAFAKVQKNTFKIRTPDAWADLDNTYGESWNSAFKGNYGQLRKIKVAHPHVSVLISIGGWTLSGQFADASSSDIKAKLFASEAVKFMKEHDFDGIDIDWEFPTKVRIADKIDNVNDEGTPDETGASKQNFTRLLKELRAKLDKQGLSDNRYYQLSAAIGSSPSHINDTTEPSKYIQYLDFLNIMSYDMHGAWDKMTNHQSPLYVNPNLPQDGVSINNAVKLLSAKGVPKNKLIIGSPFYSRGWKGVDCSNTTTLKNTDNTPLLGLNCNASGGASGRWDGGRPAGVNSWFDIVKSMRNKNGFKVYRDGYAKVPYLYNKSKKEFYTYEDEISVKEKVDYVKDNGYGGIIIWELSADTRVDLGEPLNTSLLNVIYEGFYGKSDLKSLVDKAPQKVNDSQNQDTMIENDLVSSPRATNKAMGSANIGGSLKPFDPNHGPKGNKHYNKGEKILYNNGVCMAKWWVNKDPSNDMAPWDCDYSVYIPPSTELDKAQKDKIKDSAKNIENALINNNQVTKIDNSLLKLAKDAVLKSDKSNSSNQDTDIKPLNPRELKVLADKANKCHINKVYVNGDLCKFSGSWYKFSWWTSFNGSIGASMKEVSLSDSEIPTIKVINAGGLSNWSAGKTYATKGIRIIHNSNVFETKWWSKGDIPKPFVSNTPWKHLGIADKTNDASFKGVKPPSTKDVKNAITSIDKPILVADDDQGTTATFNPEDSDTVHTEMNPEKPPVTKITPTKKFFMPFVDTTMWPPYKLSDGLAHGIKNFALSFVNSSGGNCSPTWGNYASYNIENTTLNIPAQIDEVSSNGGSIMISFGGAIAHGDELANVCKSINELTKAYQDVIDKTGVKMIDFDIEGAISYNKVNVKRRMKALKNIQTKNPNIEISFTLATMPTGLLAPSGLMVVKTAVAEGVRFSMINLMLMDYGTSYPSNIPGAYKMAAYSIQALQSVNAQLKIVLAGKESIYSKDSNGEYYNRLGAIPMIGRNDTLNEYFYKSDIEKLREFCDKVGVRMTSMWSLNRDKPISSGESKSSLLFKSTKLAKGNGSGDYGNKSMYEFSGLLQRK